MNGKKYMNKLEKYTERNRLNLRVLSQWSFCWCDCIFSSVNIIIKECQLKQNVLKPSC